MTTGLIPLRNFALVDEGKKIYRSAQPLYGYEYKWLHDVLGITTIVNLRREKRIDDKLAPKYGIKVINFDVTDHNPPNIEQANAFITLIQTSGGNLLFHCEHGHGRTSTFCVLARIALGWTLEDALQEENEKFHYSFRHHAQVEFLKQNFK